jgi:hypothetical protein
MGFGGDLLALPTTFFLAGFLAGWAVLPSPLGGWNRLFISLALSVPATLLAATPGVATHSLATWNILIGLLALAALAAWRAWEALGSFVGQARRRELGVGRPRALPLALIVLAAAVAWFTVLVPEGVEDTGDGHPNGTIVYYHWGIVGEAVEAGGLPPTLVEWGKPREFPYEYAFSVIHAASTANLAGTSGLVLEERYRIAMVLTAIFAAFALWRRWLPSWWAWLAAILTLNVSRVETRLLVYKPEAFAFILLVWSAWLLDEAIERRSRRWGALAGVVLTSSFLAHPVSSLLVAPLWGGILIGRFGPLLWRRRRRAAGRRPLLSAVPWRPVAAAAVVFVLLFIGLRTIIGTTGQELSQSSRGGVDETRVVYNLAYVSSNRFARPNVPECSHPFGVYSTVRPFFSSNASWFYFDVHHTSSVLLIFGALIAFAGALLLQAPPRLARWPERAKRAIITWSCYGLGVYLLSVLICLYYSTWVPQRVGPMRLMPYWALMFPILIAGLAWAASRLVSRLLGGRPALTRLGFRGEAGWFGAGVALVPAVLLFALATWTFTTITASRDRGVPPFEIAAPRAGGLSRDALHAYHWMSGHLPAGARVLTNGYIEGALGMLTHRTGLLDGRTPFEQPEPWRSEAIGLLADSRAFYLRPDSTGVPGAATYVVAAQRDVNLGGSYFPTDFLALAHDPALAPVRRFKGVALYRVRQARITSAGRSSGQSNGNAADMPIGSAPIKWDSLTKGQAAALAAESQPSC